MCDGECRRKARKAGLKTKLIIYLQQHSPKQDTGSTASLPLTVYFPGTTVTRPLTQPWRHQTRDQTSLPALHSTPRTRTPGDGGRKRLKFQVSSAASSTAATASSSSQEPAAKFGSGRAFRLPTHHQLRLSACLAACGACMHFQVRRFEVDAGMMDVEDSMQRHGRCGKSTM